MKGDSNAIPPIPTIPFPAASATVSMAPIPPIPIPALSEAASIASNEYSENNNNSKKIAPNFQFNLFEMNNNPKMASPGDSNSTFSPSSFSNTQSVITPNQASIQNNQNASTANNNHNNSSNGNNIILAREQYNFLLQSLHRLTNSQQSQKETIAQLLRRINTLESRMNDQSMQTEQFWSGSTFVSSQNATPSLGYSLAHDFNAMAQQTQQALSSNSSQTPPVSNMNMEFFHHHEDDEDGDDEMEEKQQLQQQHRSDGHPGLMFNDIPMHFDSNSNEFPPYI